MVYVLRVFRRPLSPKETCAIFAFNYYNKKHSIIYIYRKIYILTYKINYYCSLSYRNHKLVTRGLHLHYFSVLVIKHIAFEISSNY